MVIRKATPDDAQKVHQIAESIRINYGNPQRNGFLVYVLSEEQYRYHIERSSKFYVSEDVDGEVDGFLMCYDSEALRLLRRTLRKLDHEDGLIDFVLCQETPFIFGDQIGVQSDRRKMDIGRLMMQQLFEDMIEFQIPTIYVGILHEPVRNEASIGFVEYLGFFEAKKVRNRDGHVWGIYRLDL